MKKTKKPKLKSAVRTFFTIFIPCALILGYILSIFYQNELKAEKKVIEDQIIQTIDLQKSVIARDFDSILSDILYLAETRELRGLLEGVAYKDPVAADYSSFVKRKGIYDQIRFLDQSGMEIVRVNSRKFMPYIVPDGELQDKSHRYYFIDAIELKREQVFVSPFDLNKEKGKIEKPLKPMIRFAAPVFDRNIEKRGVVVLNYSGANLIDDVKRIGLDAIGDTMLLNSGGFWFISPEPGEEWGFMYKDGGKKTFGNRFPKVWKKISTEEAGQLYTSDGLFIFSEVYPLMGSLGARSGLRSFSEEIPDWAGAKEYAWKIISHIPKDRLESALRKTSAKYIQLFAIFTVFLAFLSFILTLSRMKRLHLSHLLEKMHISGYK
jgi:hypothetical protein